MIVHTRTNLRRVERTMSNAMLKDLFKQLRDRESKASVNREINRRARKNRNK